MAKRESERVLQLATDGGKVEVIRYWNEHRAWRFNYKTVSGSATSSSLDYGRDPQDPDHPHDFLTLGDAIHAFSPDGDWVSWSVPEVHPDYRQQVWELREQVLETADEGCQKFARQHDSQWTQACGERLAKNRHEMSEQHHEHVILPGSTLDSILGASLAVIEHLRKAPLSAEEISEFERTMIRVLEKRKAERPERS